MKTYISPVAVFPSQAVMLYVLCGTLGTPPCFYWELQDDNGRATKSGNVNMTMEQWNGWEAALIVNTETATTAYGNGREAGGNVVTDALNSDGESVTVKIVSAAVDNSDEEYILDCVSENLGLTRVKPKEKPIE